MAHLIDIQGWLEYRVRKDKEKLKELLARNVMKGPGECIIWTGALQSNRYALISVYDPREHKGPRTRKANRIKVYAHRLFWVLAFGRNIPDGMQPEHSCRVRNCVNPAHIAELVSQSENTKRMHARRK